AKVDSISFDQSGIEVVLANYLTETIADLWTAEVPIDWLGWNSACRIVCECRLCTGTEFLHRADTDAVSFSQCPINCARFCDSHFCASQKRRDSRRVGVAVTSESLTVG